jgi:hypothetical protein
MTGVSFERATGGLLFVLTVVLSLMMIRSPGTSDVSIWRDWMDTVYQNGLAGGYSQIALSGYWQAGVVYPPISFAILYVTRTLGDAGGLPPQDSIKVAILIFQLISAGLILVISRDFWVAAAFNSSILLSGVCLGYIDVFFVPWLIGAFWAFQLKRHVFGTALFLIACLTKWQPLIVVPFIAIYLFQISDFRSLRGALHKLLFWQLLMLVTVTIVLLSLVFGITPLPAALRTALAERAVSGYALNLPWIAGCLVTFVFSPSFSIQVDEFPIIYTGSVLYLLPSKIMFGIVFGTLVVRATRSDKTFQDCLLFSIVGFVTYVMCNTGVHENHWFLAVVLAFMLVLHSRIREHWAIVTIISVMANINLFVFYGVTGTTELKSRVVGVDLSIILAMLYAVAWLLLVVYVWEAAQPTKEGERTEKETHLPIMVSN